MKKNIPFMLILAVLMFQSMVQASEAAPTQAEMEAWFNDDAEFRTADVNEGELTFLPALNTNATHKARAENKIIILSTSVNDGWVNMAQCHRGLDAVPLAQLIFPEYTLRNLRITKRQGIKIAVIEAKSIQMEDISRGAELCVSMQIKALQKNNQGYYVLSNGPYQRRFLDGYYPMKLNLEIEYSQSGLKPVSIQPAEQPGLAVTDSNQKMNIDVNFEGVLRTQVSFIH